MKYRVRIKVGYCEAFFDFEDIFEASVFLATAVEKLAGTDSERDVTISMMAVREEDNDEEA